MRSLNAKEPSPRATLAGGGIEVHTRASLSGQTITHASKDELNLVRDRYEVTLVRRGLASRLPVDGTCRGYQMLNVVAGGTLVQDIHADGMTDKAHVGPGFSPIRHSVRIAEKSELARTLGTHLRSVPSMHHEALGEIGRGLTIVGRSSDGVPEAIEGDGGRVRGYQFHAELTRRSGFSKAIFASIAARARSYGHNR